MTLRLPPTLPPDEFEGWIAALRDLTGLALEAHPPGEPGEAVVANGEEIARLDMPPGVPPGGERAPLARAAGLLSHLAQDRLARRDLVAQTARLWKELNFLTGVATSLTAQATREETAATLLARIVRLFGVTRASILLSREDGRLVVAASLGGSPSTRVGAVVPSGGVAERVYSSGEPILIEDTDRMGGEDDVAGLLHRKARSNSFLSVPILSGGVPIGVINITDRVAGRPFRAEDKKLIVAIAAQAGIAFDNVRLLDEVRRSEAVKREIEIAATIQRAFLPRGPFRIPGFDVFGSCEPAAWVGGDFFQIVPRRGKGLWAAVCDVSGHGISAALLMASANAALRALITADLTPAETARSLNELMAADVGDSGMFLTAALLRVDGDGSARLCSLGHPPALFCADDGSLRKLDNGGAPAGIIEGETYEEDQFVLDPGSRLLLYTDGVSEAEGPQGLFGEERLTHWWTSRPREEEAVASATALSAALGMYRSGRRSSDDVTLLVVHRGSAA